MCHCGRRFSRLDNLRQHAQTVHGDEEIPVDSLAAIGTRFQRQIRTERARSPGGKRTTNPTNANEMNTYSQAGMSSISSAHEPTSAGYLSGFCNEPPYIRPKTDRPKPYVCGTCQKSFARIEHLKRHEWSHTREKPLDCPECARSFPRRDLLLRHQQKLHMRTIPSSKPGNRPESAASSPAGGYASRRYSVPDVYDTWGSSPKQPASRPGSVGSFQSDRGRNGLKGVFSRRSSAHSRASTGYQEIVFDSKSISSGSQASGVSGRQGPLDAVAKAAMNAVKRIGACWRCKFLRKKVSSTGSSHLADNDAQSEYCSEETPCDLCPKGHGRSIWDVVGCKRGDLKTKMPPITLCPNRGRALRLPRIESFHPLLEDPSLRLTTPVRCALGLMLIDSPMAQTANEVLQSHIERRDKELRALDPADDTQTHASLLASKNLSLGLPTPLYSSLRVPTFSPAALIPLNECILAIAWEFNDRPTTYIVREVLQNKSLENLIALLRSAAIYQAKLESVRCTYQYFLKCD